MERVLRSVRKRSASRSFALLGALLLRELRLADARDLMADLVIQKRIQNGGASGLGAIKRESEHLIFLDAIAPRNDPFPIDVSCFCVPTERMNKLLCSEISRT